MANSFIIPQQYSNLIIEGLRKRLAADNLFNRKWEGEIKKIGDKINIINFVGTGELKDYTAKQAIVPDDSKTDNLQLIIDQQKYLAFDVDITELKQNQLGQSLLKKIEDEIAYKAQKTIDSWMLSSYNEVAGTNILGSDAYASAIQLTKSNIHEYIILMKEKIKDRDANGMLNVVVAPWVTSLVEQSQVNITQNAQMLQAGITNYRFSYAGVNFIESNNVPVKYTEGDDDVLNGAITATDIDIVIADATGFEASGYAVIDNEIIYYTSIDGVTLKNCVRGCFNTISSNHSDAATIKEVGDFYYPTLMTNPELFATWAMQLTETEIVKPALYFTYLFKALFLYGKKVTNNQAATLLYSKK